VTLARSLLIATLAATLLTRPIAGVEQFPHGLLSAEPRAHYCNIDARALSFGLYDSLAGEALSAVTEIIYTCGAGNPGTATQAAKNIRIEMSRGYSSSYSDRTMAGPSFETLHYNVYLDATHRTIWGDGTNGTEFYFDAHPPNGRPVTVPVFGRVDPRQEVPGGEYVDQLTVTVLF
jgi:spore coat protein U-like protein